MFRDASSRDVSISPIGKFANLNVVFDPTFRDQPITIDLRKAKLAEALDLGRRRDAKLLAATVSGP